MKRSRVPLRDSAATMAPSRDNDESKRVRFRNWIKKVGLLGFAFFLIKGLLWLTIPALIAMFAD